MSTSEQNNDEKVVKILKLIFLKLSEIYSKLTLIEKKIGVKYKKALEEIQKWFGVFAFLMIVMIFFDIWAIWHGEKIFLMFCSSITAIVTLVAHFIIKHIFSSFGVAGSKEFKESMKDAKRALSPLLTISLLSATIFFMASMNLFTDISYQTKSILIGVGFFFAVLYAYWETDTKILGRLAFTYVLFTLGIHVFPLQYQCFVQLAGAASERTMSATNQLAADLRNEARGKHAYVSRPSVLYRADGVTNSGVHIEAGQKVKVIKTDIMVSGVDEPMSSIMLPNKHGDFVGKGVIYKIPAWKLGEIFSTSMLHKKKAQPEAREILAKGKEFRYMLEPNQATPWFKPVNGVTYAVQSPPNFSFKIFYSDGEIFHCIGNMELREIPKGVMFKVTNPEKELQPITVLGV